MNRTKSWYAIVFLLLLFINTRAQIPTDTHFLKQLWLNSRAFPSNILFVHTDKTVYTNNETIWFSAYLVENSAAVLKDHSILSMALIREDSRELVFQEKFIMQNGLSFGSAGLPDSIPPGNYLFIASTNVLDKNGKPFAVFTQPLTLKSITETTFNASLSLVDTTIVDGAVQARLRFVPKDPKSKIKAVVEYRIGSSVSKPVPLIENAAVITVRGSQIQQDNPVLLTSVKYGKEIRYLSLKLPEQEDQNIKIRFFPEGGFLSDKLESKIGWEAVNASGAPLALTAILCEDDVPIDTFSSTSYGLGSFKLKPDRRSSYHLKFPGKEGLKFSLPQVTSQPMIIQLNSGVINDTLKLSLLSLKDARIKILVHDFREAYASFDHVIKLGSNRLSILLPAIPKGLATITVLDEQGRPFAERLFFAQFDRRLTADIKSEKAEYGRRDSVKLKLTLKDKAGQPVSGVVSLAVVQENRIEGNKVQDIESYVYLNHILGNLPRDPMGRGIESKNYLEDILLVKGWRKFTWLDLMAVSAMDTIQNNKIPAITANAYYNGKALKKATTIIITRDSLFDLVETEADGAFTLSSEQILATEGRKVFLSSNEKVKEGYSIKANDPFIEVNRGLADRVEIVKSAITGKTETTDIQQLAGMEKMNVLQEVVVKADKTDDFLSGSGFFGSNACGDYVCTYNILNCSNHTFGSPPREGESYRDKYGMTIIYKGCIGMKKPTAIDLPGVYMAREFYGAENDIAIASSPLYLSTLYWNPGIIVNEKGEANFSFFTGDIAGRFRIILQGVGDQYTIYGESGFIVKGN